MSLIKILEKNKKILIQILAATLMMASCKSMSKNKKWKEVKTQDSKRKTNFFLSTMSFSPWAVLATWLHVGAS
jgi:hypothetical protein